jgi:hypothetical protein
MARTSSSSERVEPSQPPLEHAIAVLFAARVAAALVR